MPRDLEIPESPRPAEEFWQAETAQSPGQPEQPPFWRRRAVRMVLWAGAGIAALALGALLVVYVKFARITDSRLAEGPFAGTMGLYSAPRTVAVGDAMAAQEVVDRLRRSGYTTSRDNPAGWFQERSGAIEIFPGPASMTGAGSARLAFSNGKITRITAIDGSVLPDYQLDSQLIVNVTESREKRVLVRYEDIPPALVKAVVAIEDKRFFAHSGLHVLRAAKAAYVDIRDGHKQQGASTLSMQLARGLWLDPGKRWNRKFAEILIAIRIEQKLTKQQIFEYYANQIYLGMRGTYSIHGFGEASRVFFGKDLSQIDTSEAALLAGLIQRPSYYNPFRYPERVKERRDLVLSQMVHNHSLSAGQYRDATAEPIKLARNVVEGASEPYFVALLQDEIQDQVGEDARRIQNVQTTLDMDLQRAAAEAVHNGMVNVDRLLSKRKGIPPGQPQVALIALDPHTGAIKALIGGRDYSASQINHAVALRQPGSIFKPFVYTAAIASATDGRQPVFTPASILNDEDTTFYFDQQAYHPGNFHHGFMGPVTLRTALAHSLNIATVSLASQVGFDKVVKVARQAGLNDRIKATPSVALGAYEATPLEMAGAYTMFANKGISVRPTAIAVARASDGGAVYTHTTAGKPALDPRVAYVIVDMMQEVLRSGTGAGVRSRGFTLPAAGKTGTSRDGWFAGFTSELLCIVWVGFDDNRDLNLEGARSALPIWVDFMKSAAKLRPYKDAKPFQQPSGVVAVSICPESGLRAGALCPDPRPEHFIAGTQPDRDCDMHSGVTMLEGDASRAIETVYSPVPPGK